MIEIRRIPAPEGDDAAPATPADAARGRIGALLTEHAAALGISFHSRALIFEAHESTAPEGESYAGGIDAALGAAFCFVRLLAVAPAQRGKGVGALLLSAVEDEARAAGARGIWLDTFSFQAPAFYRAHGFEEVGTIAEYLPGHSRHFFVKRFPG
ncbi:GNAT family N-acetyltransferase [Pseudoroseicyclus sp. CXY001]|uniref:GNAT family N-acetyltransferase n=1 Tax=Pseudoroseicyclus sp. CXY001 TaxID=3242492 RepID=UPI0035715C75